MTTRFDSKGPHQSLVPTTSWNKNSGLFYQLNPHDLVVMLACWKVCREWIIAFAVMCRPRRFG
jgi:hypothetical protein